jgi:flavin-dependent dehydrogenase
VSLDDQPEVVAIGGGPAVSTAAASVVGSGRFAAMLLEPDHFPRYHIGEWLLASGLPVLRLSEADEQVCDYGFQVKRGATAVKATSSRGRAGSITKGTGSAGICQHGWDRRWTGSSRLATGHDSEGVGRL